MDKKKTKTAAKRASLTVDKPKEPVKPAPVVAQMVVEVEDEGKGTVPLKTIEKDTQAVEEAAQKLEEDIEKELKSEEAQIFETKPEELKTGEKGKTLSSEEKTKEVVKEFFKSDSRVAPEIAAYQKNGGTKSFLIWIILTLVVAGLTGGGLMLAVRGMPKLSSLAVKPTPTPEPLPTPTPTPSASRADLKIQVLNGGGVAGAGSKMKDLLESKGYTVSNVGNADSFDFQSTEILVKSGKEAYLSLLESDLKADYSLGTSAATLSEESAYDARVTVGKE